MEASLKNLFLRRRSKSNPPTANNVPQESLQQTSSYAAVSSGPAPKVGTLPLKPSQEKQPTRSFIYTNAKSDGLREFRQTTESANVGRPRTSPGVKPFFIGVSKPASSRMPSGSSSRGTSIDGGQVKGALPPPVPPLPKDLDIPRGPKYHDIMQFASKQHISRTTFNEHIATRNLGLPQKSVDIFEAEVNQLSGGRYNEYVAIRNIDIPRQSVDRLKKEEVALRNAVLPDTHRNNFEAMEASRKGLHSQDRGDILEKTLHEAPRQGASRLDTFSNTHGTKNGKGKTLETYRDVQMLGSEPPTNTTASISQAPKSSMVALHSPKHSGRYNDHFVEASSIAQSRTADSMPLEWLSHGKTKSSSSNDMRTRSMTAAIPSSFRNDFSGYRQDSRPYEIPKDQKGMAQTFWKARNEVPQHSTSRSLSLLEGHSSRDAFGSTTSTGTGGQQRTSSGGGSALTDGIPRHIPYNSLGSHTSSRWSPTVKSTSSSHRKRMEASGRTVMDLTDDPSLSNAGHPVHHELSGEPQQPTSYQTYRAGLSRAVREAPNTTALEQQTLSEISNSESSTVERAILPPTTRSGGTGRATELLSQTGSANNISIAHSHNSSESMSSGSTGGSATVSSLTDSQSSSFHSRVTSPNDSSAGLSPEQDQPQVFATLEGLKSNDFTDPSAFGVLARDFAVSPTHGQNHDLLRKTAQPQKESTPGKLTSIMTTKLPTGQEKVVHHISRLSLPSKQPRSRQTSLDPIAFDEDAFQRKQAEAREALQRLERDLQKNFTFASDSLNKTKGKDSPAHFRNLSLEEGAPIAPISRFSSIHVPTSVYQNKGSSGTWGADNLEGEWSPQRSPSISGLAMKNGISVPCVHSTTKHNNRNSTISTISETDVEEPSPVDSAPAPTIPLSPSSRGRSKVTKESGHGRMHSVTSTSSRGSTFSVPSHLVPDRTSSMRNSEVPEFHVGDARWE